MLKGFKFYDKVAKKFGGYHTPSKKILEYPKGDPEKIFKNKIIGLSGKNKIALDVGCADGRFTLSLAPYFKQIIGIDLSMEMLKSAKKNQIDQKIINAYFRRENGGKTSFRNNFFDLVYARRGPTFYKEFCRLLKPGGYTAEITVAESDCQKLKKIFGRGQGFGEWDNSTLELHEKELKKFGFSIIFSKEFFYNEYHKTYEDLDIFLQGVPIFEDFDSEKDKDLLKEYTNEFTTSKGILLERHRVVIIARKNN